MGDVVEFAGVMAVIVASVLSVGGGIVWVIRTGRRTTPAARLLAPAAKTAQHVDVR